MLELEPASEPAGRWSGPAHPGAWRGVLRDGAELTIRRGVTGDVRFDYDGDRASFVLDADARRLGCAVADPEALDWRRVLLSRVLPLVAIARGGEALHAGAVETPAGAVAMLAPSGGGKSTLTAELLDRGMGLLSDDVLVLTSSPGGVRAHTGSPHLSLADPAERAGASRGVLGGKHWLEIERTAERDLPVAALVLLERGAAPTTRIEELPASPLSLAPYMLGLPDDEGRDAARFDLYSDLVAEARLLRLSASTADPPESLADELERVLSDLPVATAGARG